MKRILIIATAAAGLMLAACSGHSEADKKQLEEAHAGAREMLNTITPDSLQGK